ncbi:MULTISPECIES: hypothetical protein [unclassified Sphingobacterium]|uniref:hypothetical protein n=1 Tax=unclassified Sphingobacterium TaxID=2609468 RepID=UPI00104C1021|nr:MULTISPECIES: hypothetical protein [unclassified Sphingobacterium]MCS3556213.1 hypothetical protein [Sphingobacterium sp. JUb21]TCR08585.1 hypothetical protein EDF66_103132 [Sphingobacterium sp. JUb20]
MLKLIVTLLLTFCVVELFSQSIKGVIIDSAHTTFLQATSISVFEKGEIKVSKVGLSDRYGKFILTNLPIHKDLSIELTHQGYKKVIKTLRLSPNSEIDFGHINLPMKDNKLDTIDILPPVRMNGDTLEFNADAFKLDSNAVIQDLLYKLPGLMLWGDDKITYNGKELQNVWVNGKPFFGSDKSIALQNIAKDAVKKIQVYDSREKNQQLENPDDKNYAMNVVLKEGREKMIFGNLTGGYGTDKRHDSYLTTNYADKMRQATLAFSKNNNNKNIFNLTQLLKNTTFKGVGLQNDFSSDFLSPGITQQTVAGARYQHDFMQTNQTNRSNILISDLFYNHSTVDISDSSLTKLFTEPIKENNTRSSLNVYTNETQQLDGNFNHQFSDVFNKRPITINSNLDFFQKENSSDGNSATEYNYEYNKTKNLEYRKSNSNTNYINFQTAINLLNKVSTDKSIKHFKNILNRVNLNLYYQINRRTGHDNDEIGSNFTNYIDSSFNRYLLRSYSKNNEENNNILKLDLSFKNFSFRQSLNFQHSEQNNVVMDNNKVLVDSLTHQSKFRRFIYVPTLTYRHSLYANNLMGRKNSQMNLNINFGARWQNEKNNSSLAFRNLSQFFFTILPEIGLEQIFSRVNFYQQKASISYKYEEEYPELDRLRPFYDDINPSYRYYGAKSLKKVNKHILSALFSFSQYKQHGYIISLSPSLRFIQNGFADSILNKPNQIQYYSIQNTKPTYLLNLGYNLEKAFLLRKDQNISLNLKGNVNSGNNFQYTDGTNREISTFSSNLNLNCYYTSLNNIIFGFINTWNYSKQNNKEDDLVYYASHFVSTGLSTTLALSKNWSINSNASSRYTSSTFSSDRMVIWNANTSFRMLKGSNLELKVSAYDLLKQNKGIYFRNSNSEFTTGYLNNLRQYFMFSLSYYPRKFGL